VHRVDARDEARSTGAVIAANARVSVLGSTRVRFEDLRIEVARSNFEAIERVAREVDADVVVVEGRFRSRSGGPASGYAIDSPDACLVIFRRASTRSSSGSTRATSA